MASLPKCACIEYLPCLVRPCNHVYFIWGTQLGACLNLIVLMCKYIDQTLVSRQWPVRPPVSGKQAGVNWNICKFFSSDYIKRGQHKYLGNIMTSSESWPEHLLSMIKIDLLVMVSCSSFIWILWQRSWVIKLPVIFESPLIFCELLLRNSKKSKVHDPPHHWLTQVL